MIEQNATSTATLTGERAGERLRRRRAVGEGRRRRGGRRGPARGAPAGDGRRAPAPPHAASLPAARHGRRRPADVDAVARRRRPHRRRAGQNAALPPPAHRPHSGRSICFSSFFLAHVLVAECISSSFTLVPVEVFRFHLIPTLFNLTKSKRNLT